jgi:REP element-mobilizing transposase RayT
MTAYPRRKRTRLPDSVLYRQNGRIFLVTACTRERREIFADVHFGSRCIDALRALADRRGTAVYAYCLMPDHVHLVLGVHPESSLSAFLQAWKSVCTKLWREAGRGKSFWQRGFHERALRRDEHLRAACLYVLANPVRKGLVREWQEYPLGGSLEWTL